MSPRATSALPGIALMEQTPIIIEKILLDVPDSTLAWKPAKDRWSINEVLAHLSDLDSFFCERTRRIAQEDNPMLPGYDQNAVYTTGKYSKGVGREDLKKFCHERDRSLSFLRYLPSTAVSRSGKHEKLGTITVGQLMNEWAFHDLGHIRQISELLRARAFFPNIGPFQQYYSIRP